MDWIKVLNRHTIFEYTDLKDSEFVAWIKIMSLTALMEKEPTRDQMLKYTHHKTLTSLQDKLKTHSTTLQDILKKVLRDAQEVNIRREVWKNKKKKLRELKQNVPGDVPGDVPRIEKEKEIDIEKDKDNKEKGEDFPPCPSPEIKDPKKKTIPPLLEDVITYCVERKNSIDPEAWMAFYTSNGWMVGKNKMRDWKAAVITWEKRGDNGQRRTNSTRGNRLPEISSPPEWEGTDVPLDIPKTAEERKQAAERARALAEGIGNLRK